jgi:hypothetical protein
MLLNTFRTTSETLPNRKKANIGKNKRGYFPTPQRTPNKSTPLQLLKDCQGGIMSFKF